MPVFATPTRLRDVIFSPAPIIGRRRKVIALVLVAIGLSTITLTMFSYDLQEQGRVNWTCLDLIASARGTPVKALPPLHAWSYSPFGGVWNPLFLIEVGFLYSLLLFETVCFLVPAMTRFLSFVGILALVAALSFPRTARWPFTEYVRGVHSGSAPFIMLTVVLLLVIVIHMESLDL